MLVLKEPLALRALLVLKETLVPMAPLVKVVTKVTKATKDKKDATALLVPKEPLVLRVLKEI
jgi:hypothetical protein